jgi:hypothetical protein
MVTSSMASPIEDPACDVPAIGFADTLALL